MRHADIKKKKKTPRTFLYLCEGNVSCAIIDTSLNLRASH